MKKFIFTLFLFLSISASGSYAAWNPEMVRTSFDGTNVMLHWLPVTYTASNYAVYRSGVTLAADADWNALTALAVYTQTADSHIDAVPATYTSYYYRIKKYTTALDGEFSLVASSSPYPETTSAYESYDSKVVLKWLKSADAGVQYYNVYRSTSPAIFDYAAVGRTSDDKIIDYTAANLIKYYYRIMPVGAFEGALSQPVTATPFAAPFAPSGVTYSASGTAATIAWVTSSARASYDIAGYNVYRSLSAVTLSDFIAQTLNGYYYDSALVPGMRYNYHIRTVDINSNLSAPAAFSVLIPGPPPAPANMHASANAVSALITWNLNASDEGVNLYHIYESGAEIGTSAGNSYTDSAAALGGAYLYTVTAENTFGESAESSPAAVTVKPSAPAGVAVTKGMEPATLKLTWSYPSAVLENVTGYNIYRATGPDSFDFSAPAVVTFTSYDDISLAAGASYYYCVSGYSSIEGARSVTVSAVPVSKTAAVLNLTAVPNNNYAFLDWDDAGPAYDVTSYKIYRSTDPDSGTFVFATSTAGTVSQGYVTGLTLLNQPYYLKVTAVNFYGEGNTETASYVDVTITAGAAPEKPVNLTATASAGDARVSLFWDAAPPGSGVTSYNIYRRISSGSYNYVSPNAIVATNYYTDLSAAAGAVYYYEVKAQGSGIESLSSIEAGARPFYRPYAVKNLTGSYVSGSIWLIWSGPDQTGTDDYSPKRYNVYRSTGAVFTGGPLISGLTDGVYIDSAINTYTSAYHYKVKTYDTNGVEDSDSSVVSIAISPVQQPPGQLVAIAGDSRATLIWRMVTPLYYNIYRREDSTPAYSSPVAYNVSFSLKDYTDTGLTNGVLYHYVIKAVNSTGEGPASIEAHVMPYKALQLPSDSSVSAQIVNNKDILLSWNDAVGDSLSGYYVMRSDDGGGSYSQPLTLTALTNYTDMSTQWGETYYYLIKTLDTSGHSDAVYTPVKVTLPTPQNRVRVYRNLLNLSLGETLKLNYVLTQSGNVKLRVYTLSGAFVTELINTNIAGAISGQNPYYSADLYWDGRNKAGEKVASGVYLLTLETPGARVIEKVAVVR